MGAALGAGIAAREQNRQGRLILIVGDGSLQMTVQEISSYIRFGLKPVIFVINNAGYSIERAIHGEEQGYNNINLQWNYQQILTVFGVKSSTGSKGASVRCQTVEELEKVLNDDAFGNGEHIQVLESVCTQLRLPY